jgi:hypothetical protein
VETSALKAKWVRHAKRRSETGTRRSTSQSPIAVWNPSIPESQPIAAADGHPAAMQCVRRTARFVTGGSRVPRDLPMILASFITLQRSDVKLSLHNERRHVRDGWKAALFVLAAMACFAVVGLIGHRLPQALKPSRRAPS